MNFGGRGFTMTRKKKVETMEPEEEETISEKIEERIGKRS